MNNYYFTFGTNEHYPYGINDYVEISANTEAEARDMFNRVHPPVVCDFLNCAFVYSEKEFNSFRDKYYKGVLPAERLVATQGRLVDYKDNIDISDCDINDIGDELSLDFGIEMWNDEAYKVLYPDLDNLPDDAWVNFYIEAHPDFKAIFFVDYADHIEQYDYLLNDSETEMFKDKINEYLLAKEDKSLDEFIKDVEKMSSDEIFERNFEEDDIELEE